MLNPRVVLGFGQSCGGGLSPSSGACRTEIAAVSHYAPKAFRRPAGSNREHFKVHHGSNAILVNLGGAKRYVALTHVKTWSKSLNLKAINDFKTFRYINYVTTWAPEPPFEIDWVQPLDQIDACIAKRTGAASLVYMSSLSLLNDPEQPSPGNATLSSKVVVGVGIDDSSSWALRTTLLVLLRDHPKVNRVSKPKSKSKATSKTTSKTISKSTSKGVNLFQKLVG